MITGLIAAFFLLALGVAAKGAIAHALVIAAAWVTKNVLLLGFLRTRTGRRTVRNVRHAAYSNLGGKKRRLAYRAFEGVSRMAAGVAAAERRFLGLFSRRGG